MREIVKIQNDLIDLPLKNFNAVEIDIFNALCYECQEKNTEEIVLDFKRIKELCRYKSKDNARFIKDLVSMNDNLMSLRFRLIDENECIHQFVLFPKFTTDPKNSTLKIRVAEEFAYLLNNLKNNYTSMAEHGIEDRTTVIISMSKEKLSDKSR